MGQANRQADSHAVAMEGHSNQVSCLFFSTQHCFFQTVTGWSWDLWQIMRHSDLDSVLICKGKIALMIFKVSFSFNFFLCVSIEQWEAVWPTQIDMENAPYSIKKDLLKRWKHQPFYSPSLPSIKESKRKRRKKQDVQDVLFFQKGNLGAVWQHHRENKLLVWLDINTEELKLLPQIFILLYKLYHRMA